MTAFRYSLVLVTHGRAPDLDRVLAAFAANVTPAPSRLLAVVDGAGSRRPPADPLGPFETVVLAEQSGFCAATRTAWKEALSADDPHSHVFWLENDFVVTRPVDVAALAEVLDADHGLAQMQLMRQAVNEFERAAGGLYESRADQYEQRALRIVQPELRHIASWPPRPDDPEPGTVTQEAGATEYPWLEHRAYMTTNPSLMRASFMAANPWPEGYQSECEGRFGIDLVERGYRFGVWGTGEPWVQHVGVRDGFGY